jgi:hypothetical protein
MQPDLMAPSDNGHGSPSTTRTPADRAAYGAPPDPRAPQPKQRHSHLLWICALILIVILGCVSRLTQDIEEKRGGIGPPPVVRPF